jgi:site-specific recombinase XerD
VRRSFKRVYDAATIGRNWTPRELRHSFGGIMSDRGVPLERIADMEIMDDVFGRPSPRPSRYARYRS